MVAHAATRNPSAPPDHCQPGCSEAVEVHAHKEVLVVEGSAALEDLEIGLQWTGKRRTGPDLLLSVS